jgi:hypothetical protein
MCKNHFFAEFKKKHRTLLIFLGIPLVVLYLWGFTHHHSPISSSSRYCVIFEAASSRTVVYLFKFDHPFKNFTSVVEMKDVKPGIHNFANDLSQIKGYLSPLMEYARNSLQNFAHKKVYVFFLATAGVRLLGGF